MTQTVKIAYKALDDKFGEDIVVLDISGVSVMADYFIIATGKNPSQIKAMTDETMSQLHKAGIKARHTEGQDTAQWVLLDFDDVIIHIFDEDSREFYSLERVWSDAVAVDCRQA
jgi:ribosome-associated protein